MKRLKAFARIIILLLLVCLPATMQANRFALDSIAEWGKFPRFCVNTYRWGDRFFNGYDTTYVQGTGYKFNAKLATDSWADGYRFITPNDTHIYMRSNPSTSIGAHLSYLALSVGYDINISKLFGHDEHDRKRFRFGFNCMLFSAEVYFSTNDIGCTIREFGPKGSPANLNYPFSGVNNRTWGIDAYYFFNHKRYSEAATFNFSRIQRKSQGSFFAGFSLNTQQIDFDFRYLPTNLDQYLPQDWPDKRYHVNTHNYALRLGYGYNWCFAKDWVLGVSESPVIGVRKGYVNSDVEKVSMSLYNRLKLSCVWNGGRWFGGLLCKFDVAIINDQRTTYTGGILSAEAVIGYRFNLW